MPYANSCGTGGTFTRWRLFQATGYPGCYILADDLDLDEERIFRLDRIDWQP